MVATFTKQVRERVVERYLPGARQTQHTLGGIAVATIGLFGTFAWVERDPAWVAACVPGLLIASFAVVMRLRSVKFFIHHPTQAVRREARWAGRLCSVVRLNLADFHSVEFGSATGGRTLPVFWARLVGRTKYTIAESGNEAEVLAVIRTISPLLPRRHVERPVQAA